MKSVTSDLVVRKSIVVQVSPEQAFRVFTEGLASWWPFKGHSIFGENVDTVVIEGRVGGRWYERSKSGEEALVGTLTAWEPPDRFAVDWHPGRGEETAQQLEIRFLPEGEAATRVEVVHTGWDRLADRIEETVASYDEGWGSVLGRFAAAAGKEC
jgi:uncharacterized protein YndB with AHSA1/START domain